MTFLWREGIISNLLEMLCEGVLFVLLSPYYFLRFLAKRRVRRNHEARVESHVPQPKPRQGPSSASSPPAAVPPRGGRNHDRAVVVEASVQEPVKLEDQPSRVPFVPGSRETKIVRASPSVVPSASGDSGPSTPYSEPGKHPAPASAHQAQDSEAQAVSEERKSDAAERRTQVEQRQQRKPKQESQPTPRAHENRPGSLPGKERHRTRETRGEHARPEASGKSEPDIVYRASRGAALAEPEPKRPAISRPASAEREAGSGGLGGPSEDDELVFLGVFHEDGPREVVDASASEPKGLVGKAHGAVTATAEMGAEKLAKREAEPPDTVVPVHEKMAKVPERVDVADEGTASDDEAKVDGSSPDSGSTRARRKDVDLFSRM